MVSRSQSAGDVPEDLAKLGFVLLPAFRMRIESDWALVDQRLDFQRLDRSSRIIVRVDAWGSEGSRPRFVIWDSPTGAIYSTSDPELLGRISPASSEERASALTQFQRYVERAKAAGTLELMTATEAGTRRAGSPKKSYKKKSPETRDGRSGTRSNRVAPSVPLMDDDELLDWMLDDEVEAEAATVTSTSEREVSSLPIVLTPEQRNVIDRLNAVNGGLMLITGAAGTGKSVVVKELMKGVNAIAVAPTGMAAMAIGGTTVHRMFGLPIGVIDPTVAVAPTRLVQESLQLVRRVIIDEASMLRADLLDAVDAVLRSVHRSSKAFGGVQIILIGDPYQLPPVATVPDAERLKEAGYRTHFFYSARVIRKHRPEHVELLLQHRQASDAAFLGMLNRIRRGHHHAGDLAALNARVVNKDGIRPESLFLCARNAEADAINARRLASLRGRVHQYSAVDCWPPSEKPAEASIELKIGARVIFTKNDKAQRWVNGSRGQVFGLRSTSVRVRMDNGEEVEVEPARWELREPSSSSVSAVEYDEREEKDDVDADDWRYDGGESGRDAVPTVRDKQLVWRVVGSYEQIPLRLGWAITIHKSQGMTLSDAAIDLGRGSFATGQVYVALSRLRQLRDLALVRPIRDADVRVEPSTEAFFNWLKPVVRNKYRQE